MYIHTIYLSIYILDITLFQNGQMNYASFEIYVYNLMTFVIYWWKYDQDRGYFSQ